MAKSLASVLRKWLIAFAVVAVAAFGVSAVAVFHQANEEAAQSLLLARARQYADALDGIAPDERTQYLQEQVAGSLRITLIGADGNVAYDSKSNASSMDNHANRPEIAAAESAGEGTSGRLSETLSQDTIYAAVRLVDNEVIRLSEQRESLAAFVGSSAIPLLGVFAVLVVLAILCSIFLSRRIMEPVNQIDAARPKDHVAYKEMKPLLQRIDDQQAELRLKNEELAHADALRRDFTSNVSHDMKTPLHVISGYSELMSSGMMPEEDMRRSSRVMHEEAQRLSRLVDDVLTLSQLDSADVDSMSTETVDLAATAKTACERLAPVAKNAGVALDVEVPHTPIRINGNTKLLDEMAYNLIDNAIRYSGNDGEVQISVYVERDDAEKGLACLRVSDNGCGIPEEDRERVFGRFVRLDKSRRADTGGTGLGLAIVKHVAQVHGGSIMLESEVGVGSTFTAKLPIPQAS